MNAQNPNQTSVPVDTQVTATPEQSRDPATVTVQERNNAKVLALGGIAAGVASGVIVLLAEREQKPKTKLELAREALDEVTEKARKGGFTFDHNFTADVQKSRLTAGKKGKKAAKGLRISSGKGGKKAKPGSQASMAMVSGLLDAARQEVTGKYHDIEKQAPHLEDLAKQFRSQKDHAIKDARKGGKEARKEAERRARAAKSDVTSLVGSLKDSAGQAGKYLESSVVPALKDLEHGTAHAYGVGKVKTGELRKRAEKDIIPQARAKSEELRKRAEKDYVPQAKDTAQKLKHSFEGFEKEAAKTLTKNAAEATTRLSTAAEGVETQAKDAGEAVRRGGRETRSLLLWLALAGVLIFTVFLDEEQQNKVRAVVSSFLGEAQNMYGDIKGQNGSFTS